MALVNCLRQAHCGNIREDAKEGSVNKISRSNFSGYNDSRMSPATANELVGKSAVTPAGFGISFPCKAEKAGRFSSLSSSTSMSRGGERNRSANRYSKNTGGKYLTTPSKSFLGSLV